MRFNCSVCVVVLVGTILFSGIDCKISEADSFDESFEDDVVTVDPELKKALAPAEDAFLGFINKLVNTGYTSSKIALNRIEKASQKRREFGDQLEEFLGRLPTFSSEIPVIDQMPRALDNRNKPSRLISQK